MTLINNIESIIIITTIISNRSISKWKWLLPLGGIMQTFVYLNVTRKYNWKWYFAAIG